MIKSRILCIRPGGYTISTGEIYKEGQTDSVKQTRHVTKIEIPRHGRDD
jgi:hypothetical protein